MKGKQYLLEVIGIAENVDRIKVLENLYQTTFPEIVKNIISAANEACFLDDGSRVMSYEEMVNAEKDLHVAFSELGIFPIIDCGENDFIVYHINTKTWSKFNINDEISFKSRENLEELI